MPRITSYNLYQCPTCKQIHIKPNYGSISIYVPLDAFINDSDLMVCKGCGLKQAIDTFLYIGIRAKRNSHKPNLFERLAIRFGFKEPALELDVRRLYPSLT